MNNNIMRNIRLVLTILAMVLQFVPKDNIYFSVAAGVFTAGVIIWVFWKNNSFTVAAKLADLIMAEMKAGDLDMAEVFDLALQAFQETEDEDTEETDEE